MRRLVYITSAHAQKKRPHTKRCAGANAQNRPVMRPSSSTSMFSAAGTFGRPGIVSTSPVSATRKPAPADTVTLRTVTVKPAGAPSSAGSSDRLACVLAMHTGRPPKPSASSSRICLRAAGRISAPAPP